MSRWDEWNNDDFDSVTAEEEAQLLKKFQDYKDLEKLELERSKKNKFAKTKKQSSWTSRFFISTIVQLAAVATLSFSLLLFVISQPQSDLNQFLSLKWEGASIWFIFGYVLFVTLIVVTAVMAIFYHHLETNLKRKFSGYRNLLSWMHLIGINVGGTIAATSMVIVGFSNMSELVFLNSFGELFGVEGGFFNQMASVIGGFVVVLILGALAGGISLISAFLEKNSKISLNEFSTLGN